MKKLISLACVLTLAFVFATQAFAVTTDVDQPTVDDSSENEIALMYYGWDYYVNTTAGLYLREGPSTAYSSVALLPYKTELSSYSGSSNWSEDANGDTWCYVRVISGDNYGSYGWVSWKYLGVLAAP